MPTPHALSGSVAPRDPKLSAVLEADLAAVTIQEQHLRFSTFNPDTAFALGTRLRTLALDLHKPVAIGIWLGQQTLFYAGTDGIVPSSEEWLRRKRNTVLRLGQSTLRVGIDLARTGDTLESKHHLSLTDFVSHGGGFPLLLRGTGCVGCIGVSGLPQRDDHTLLVRALSEHLGVTVPHIAQTTP